MSERSPADGSPVGDSGSVGAPSAGHRSSFDGSESRTVLLIGKGELADATQRALRAAGAQVIRLHEPTDGEIRESLGEEVDSVAVISGDDVVSLRQALVVGNVRPGSPGPRTTDCPWSSDGAAAASCSSASRSAAHAPWPR